MAGTAASSNRARGGRGAEGRCSRRRHGIGQHVDISIAETHFGGVNRRPATAIAYQFSGRKSPRAAGAGSGHAQGIYPAPMATWISPTPGSAPIDCRTCSPCRLAHDPRYNDPIQRMDPYVIEEWNTYFLVWCLERTKREVWAEGQRARELCAPLFSMDDLFNDEHFRGPRILDQDRTPELGGWSFPAGRSRWQAAAGSSDGRRRCRPAHRRSAAGVRHQSSQAERDRKAGGGAMNPKPLEGIRVIDLCVVWAGPFATMCLATSVPR